MTVLVGKKCGMTRIFEEDGTSNPVTVIEVSGNRITQIKTKEIDGYCALQVTAGEKKAKHVSKPQAGHFAKANVAAGELLYEIRTDESGLADKKVGDELTVSALSVGQKVDVTAKSKGKGFAGVIKRHNFAMQDATHGNSLAHRAPGSIGQCQTPGRVFKGKKMAGQMGNVQKTVQSLKIVRIDEERGLVLVKGGVPGAPGSYVTIRNAVKEMNAKG